MKHVVFCVALAICALPLHAQTVEFSAQLRERSEFNMKSFATGSSPDVYHLLRTRLRADAFDHFEPGTPDDRDGAKDFRNVRSGLEIHEASAFLS